MVSGSSRVNLKDVHLASRQMELHGLKNRVCLLVLSDTQVKVVLSGVVVHLLGGIVDLPESQDAIAQQEPTESACRLVENLAHVKESFCSSTRHHVNEQEGKT